MKKLIFSIAIVAVLVLSSIAVFADGSSTGAAADALNDIFAGVTGAKSSEIAELRAQGVGYGRLIPASILAKKLGISLKEAANLKETGETYAQVAQEKGISLEEFKNEMLARKNSLIDERVKAGYITKEQGDALKERIKDNIANCNGTGSNRADGQGMMGSRGRGNGAGQGMMGGRGGRRNGAGQGMMGGRGLCSVAASPAN